MSERISSTRGIIVFSSTIIGAGILALPAAAAASGLFPLLVVLLVIAVISLLSAFYISELVLHMDEPHHLPSLAREYLGNWGLALMLLGTFVYIYGALTGYLTAGGQLFFSLSQGAIPVWAGTFFYFLVASLVIHFGMKIVSRIGTYLFFAMILLLGAIIIMAAPEIKTSFLLEAEWRSGPQVFGIVLFAYIGHSVIPSIANSLADRHRIYLVSFAGIAVPFLLYGVWSLVVIGIVPTQSETVHSLQAARATGQPVTIPLGAIVGGSIVILGNIFAIFSTMTSYVGFGLSMKDGYSNLAITFGRRMGNVQSTLLVVIPPLLVALFNPTVFIRALEISGAYGGGLFVGVLPALMVIRKRSRGSPPAEETKHSSWGNLITPWLVLSIYAAGMIYTTIQLLR
jgi:tyrosine-specific transport protein